MDYGHHSLFFQSQGELHLGFKYPKLEASVESNKFKELV